MNYSKIYDQIISKREQACVTGYSEKHHILPRALGGSNKKSNIVRLTAKEHFICHLLLVKMQVRKSNDWYKMIKAFMMMKVVSKTHSRYTSNLYKHFREEFAMAQCISQTGSGNSQFGQMWIYSEALRKSTKIGKKSPIPDGWKKGRIIDFDAMDKKKEKILKLQMRKADIRNVQSSIAASPTAITKRTIDRQKRTIAKKEKIIQMAVNLYDEYRNGDYVSLRDFCERSYDKSVVSISVMWEKFIPEFKENCRQGKPYVV